MRIWFPLDLQWLWTDKLSLWPIPFLNEKLLTNSDLVLGYLGKLLIPADMWKTNLRNLFNRFVPNYFHQVSQNNPKSCFKWKFISSQRTRDLAANWRKGWRIPPFSHHKDFNKKLLKKTKRCSRKAMKVWRCYLNTWILSINLTKKSCNEVNFHSLTFYEKWQTWENVD